MKAHDKEFYELRIAFENSLKRYSRLPSYNLSRASRDEKNSFYDNGETDKAFHLFMLGYEYHKSISRLES